MFKMKNHRVLFTRVVLVSLLLGIFANSYKEVQKKDALFLDEVCSFYYANSNIITIPEFIDLASNGGVENKLTDLIDAEKFTVLGQEDVLKRCYVSQSSGFNYFSIIFILSIIDKHPPLYYFILHTICSVTKSDNLVMIGYGVNIFFLLLTCFLVYRIINIISNNRTIGLAAVVLWGFSYEFIDNAAFFRMYVLLGFLLTLLSYLYIRVAYKNWSITNKTLGLLCVVQFLAMYTQYFAVFFILPLFFVSLYFLKKDKPLRNKYICANIISGIIYVILWPQIFIQMLKGLSTKADLGTANPILRVCSYTLSLCKSFFSGNAILFVSMLMIIAIICVAGNYLLKKNRCPQFCDVSNWCILSIPVFSYFIIVSYSSPWVSSQYQSPIMPLISILLTGGLWTALSILTSHTVKRVTLLLISVISLSLYGQSKTAYFLYERTPEKSEFIRKYSSRQAIIYDGEFNQYYADVIVNYYHPLYIKTNERYNADQIQKQLINNEYILYVYKSSDGNILDLLKDAHYDYDKTEYQLQFYDVYDVRYKFK